jgi:hypothetical protein
MAAQRQDIRLAVGAADHPKMKKLDRRLDGDPSDPFRCWIRLLSHARVNKSDGRLDGMTSEDIEIAAGWTRRAGAFVSAMLEVKLLEQEPEAGCFIIHDWEENQPFASGSAARSEHARKAAQARWNRFDSLGAECPEQCPEHEGVLHRASNGNALFSSSPSDPDRFGSSRTDPDNASPEADFASGRKRSEQRQVSPQPAAEFTGHDPSLLEPSGEPTIASPLAELSATFDEFYAQYPRHVGRDAAAKVWRRLNAADRQAALDDLPGRKMAWERARTEPQFIPHPATWLNQRRWTDELPKGARLGAQSAMRMSAGMENLVRIAQGGKLFDDDSGTDRTGPLANQRRLVSAAGGRSDDCGMARSPDAGRFGRCDGSGGVSDSDGSRGASDARNSVPDRVAESGAPGCGDASKDSRIAGAVANAGGDRAGAFGTAGVRG